MNDRKINGFDYQLIHTNYASVYKLSDNQVILLSPTKTKEGLLIKNEECLKDMIESDYFPIEDPLLKNESFKKMHDFNKYSIDFVENWLIKKYDLNFDLEEIGFVELREIFQKSESSSKKRSIDEFEILHFCTGQLIINRVLRHL